jgi:hypothetical protein
VLAFGIEQPLEALLDDPFEPDASGDERVGVESAVAQHLDHHAVLLGGARPAQVRERPRHRPLAEHQLVEVGADRLLPDAHDRRPAARGGARDGVVERRLHARDLEGGVGAAVGGRAHVLDGVGLGGVDDLVGAAVDGPLAPRRSRLGDDDPPRAGGPRTLDHREPDRAAAEDGDGVAGPEPGATNRVQPHAQGFDQRAVLDRYVVAERNGVFGVQHDALGEPAAAAGEPDEPDRIADVVVALPALPTRPTAEDGVDRDRVTDGEVRYVLTDLGDHAAELVSHPDRRRLPRDGMRRLPGGEDRSRGVLVEVRPADPARVDVDPDVARTDRTRFDVLDADVLPVVVDGCSHGVLTIIMNYDKPAGRPTP